MSGRRGEARGLLSHDDLRHPVNLLVLHEQPGLLEAEHDVRASSSAKIDGSPAAVHRDDIGVVVVERKVR